MIAISIVSVFNPSHDTFTTILPPPAPQTPRTLKYSHHFAVPSVPDTVLVIGQVARVPIATANKNPIPADNLHFDHELLHVAYRHDVPACV